MVLCTKLIGGKIRHFKEAISPQTGHIELIQ